MQINDLNSLNCCGVHAPPPSPEEKRIKKTEMQLVLDPCKYGLKANHDDHNEGVTKQKIKLADQHVRIKSLYIF